MTLPRNHDLAGKESVTLNFAARLRRAPQSVKANMGGSRWIDGSAWLLAALFAASQRYLAERIVGSRDLVTQLRRSPRGVLAGIDASAWLAATLVVAGLRYLDSGLATPWLIALFLGVGMAAIHVTTAWVMRLYSGRHRLGSADEATVLAAIVIFSSCCAVLVVGAPWPSRPSAISIPIVAGALALISILGSRLFLRVLVELTARPTSATRAIIVGAGDAGTSLVRDLLANPASPYLPVAFVDDSPAKKHYRVGPVCVEGDVSSLSQLIREKCAERILIAAPSASNELYRRVVKQTDGTPVKVKSLPPLSELVADSVGFTELRDLNMTDILGRSQVQTDLSQVSSYLTGRRVLVTGAGGSIGSELCRQVNQLKPAALGMLDRDESALHQLQLSLDGRGLLDTRNLILADIRDPEALAAVMAEFKPDVVFHAAALKHLPMLEMYPHEAWKSNVRGTENVLSAATAVGVGVFVNISTDKAADPTSVLGRSKRLAEQLTANAAANSSGKYASVRFGNVLGSRGSVLTAFTEQIRSGGPVTVTDPDVTRYFMTIAEAVQLVLQSGALGGAGEVMVLEMGTPVRIQEMAEQVIALSGKQVEIVHTGLRPGEKMHEVLASEHENLNPTEHPLIGHVPVPPIDPSWLFTDDPIQDKRMATDHMQPDLAAVRAGDQGIDIREIISLRKVSSNHVQRGVAALRVASGRITVRPRETTEAPRQRRRNSDLV